ncbi:unnamed protein product [Blepharisma stoltei]|uniref:Uncharacterized protein n=1 Tax=Blepharisma stoltei TaxID=1481888 RepID=A0AAU9IGU9_9CILI|nr:unnamed protein product [Blepharisma stoltei]
MKSQLKRLNAWLMIMIANTWHLLEIADKRRMKRFRKLFRKKWALFQQKKHWNYFLRIFWDLLRLYLLKSAY